MTVLLLILLVVAVAAIAVALWFFVQQRRSAQLRAGFGPEYDRTLREQGDRSAAERELTARQERVQAFEIRPLSSAEQVRFAEAWRQTQAEFVDDPGGAVTAADDLIGAVMAARGYPVSDFDQRAADLSVDHPTVVTHYRAAHAIAQAQQAGGASTEDLRQALVHYRALFADLLDTSPATDDQRNGHESSVDAPKEATR
jgi:hypothetical protein